jgi:hypothetical protein
MALILGREWKWVANSKPENKGISKKFGYITNGTISYQALRFPGPVATLLEQLKPLFGLHTLGSYFLCSNRGNDEIKKNSIILVDPAMQAIDKPMYLSNVPGATELNADYLKMAVYRNVLHIFFQCKSVQYFTCSTGPEPNAAKRLISYHYRFVKSSDNRFQSLASDAIPHINTAYQLLGLNNGEDTNNLARRIFDLCKVVDIESMSELGNVIYELNRRIPV